MFWLLVSTNPSEKWWSEFVSWDDMTSPTEWEKKTSCSKPPSSVSSVHRAMPGSNAPRAPSSFPYFRMEFLNARLPMRLDPSFEASGHLHSGPSFAIPMIRPIGFNPHAWLLQSFCAELWHKTINIRCIPKSFLACFNSIFIFHQQIKFHALAEISAAQAQLSSGPMCLVTQSQ